MKMFCYEIKDQKGEIFSTWVDASVSGKLAKERALKNYLIEVLGIQAYKVEEEDDLRELEVLDVRLVDADFGNEVTNALWKKHQQDVEKGYSEYEFGPMKRKNNES